MSISRIAYPDPETLSIVKEVLTHGSKVNSRYGPCIELIGGRVEYPSSMLITKKNMNYSLGWMELLQVIDGSFDPEAIKRVAPNANHSLFTEAMAYGPRLKDQMEELIASLKYVPDTRQAVVFIGKSWDHMSPSLPCTLTIQFLVRQGVVHSVVSMRSWDLCRGLPYDWIVFSGLTVAVSRCLGLEAGNVTVHAGSAHIYEDLMDQLPRVADKDWTLMDGPTDWQGFRSWAVENMAFLEKGEAPSHIEYV